MISIDVEEEGLFCGRYPRVPPGVTNVAELRRLEFISRDFGFPLTLLVSYRVAQDPAACRVLAHWRDRYGAEIGVHLHHWNTPPFQDLPHPEPVPAENLDRALLRDKIARLINQVQGALGATPRAFRMGRFDIGPQVLGLLPELGLTVDSSVVPLSPKSAAPGHFLAPPDPFWLPGDGVLEVPLTMMPVLAGTPELACQLAAALPPAWGRRLLDRFRSVAAVGVQPAWYPLPSMRWAVRLHRCRGGRALNMFLHSSELQPGASRFFPTEAAVGRLMARLRAFLAWLVKTGPVEGVTLSGLREEWLRDGRPGPPQ